MNMLAVLPLNGLLSHKWHITAFLHIFMDKSYEEGEFMKVILKIAVFVLALAAIIFLGSWIVNRSAVDSAISRAISLSANHPQT